MFQAKHRRRWSFLMLLALIPSFMIMAMPRSAAAVPQKQPFFISNFDLLTQGTMTAGESVDVELGSVYAETDTVEVVASPASGGNALAVSNGTGAAELRFKWYPDALPDVNGNDPFVNGNDRYDLVVNATLSADDDTATGGQLGLEVGGSFFEFFTFDAGGIITREGTDTGATYSVDSAVELEARIHLATNKVDITISGDSGTVIVDNIDLPGAFSRSSMNLVQFQANGGAGVYTIDDVYIEIDREAGGPPADIEMPEPEIEFEEEDGNTFMMIKIKIKNNGGSAIGVFLNIDLEVFMELVDLEWLEGQGYVVEIDADGKLKIGIGLNNRLDFDQGVELKIKIKINASGVKIQIKIKLNYSDSAGDHDDDLEVPTCDDDGNCDDDDGDDCDDDSDDGDDDNGDDSDDCDDSDDGDDDDSDDCDDSDDGDDDNGDDDSDDSDDCDDDNGDDDGDDNSDDCEGMDVECGDDSDEPMIRLPVTSIDIRFQIRWQVGGLRIYGYPLTEPMRREDGVTVQYFERVRMEHHPENAGTEYEILLGLMSVELGYQAEAQPAPTDSAELEWYFEATGHVIDPAFRSFWNDRGGLYTYGYPIAPAFVDSNGRFVQYFERTRLELHPENAGTEYEILLGLLGEEMLQGDLR